MALSFTLTATEQAILARCARQSIESVLAGIARPLPSVEDIVRAVEQESGAAAQAAAENPGSGALAAQARNSAADKDKTHEPRSQNHEQTPLLRDLGSFVTLTIDGLLRGCMGSIIGREALYANVWHMAQSAAFHDPRFSPLDLAQWVRTDIHISVLDSLTLCPDPAAIVIGRHGLALDYMGHFGVFLPQVPVEQGWNLAMYLDQLCAKAGVPAGSWRMPVARLYWYEACVFPA